jgi:nucleoside-diphosphate-sugar epimerase
MKILIVGGSGFVSGTLARSALARGHEVWVVTRGQKPLAPGGIPLRADRKDPAAFAAAVTGAKTRWDLVVDCIGYEVEDARQDVEVFSGRAGHLVFISTDFVFDPARRRFPQPFDNPATLSDDSYGGKKQLCEKILLTADTDGMLRTVFRPCHIYGPGSNLGCLPNALRDPGLLQKIREGQPLSLVGGGRFLQQPIYAPDLAELILSVRGNVLADRKIYCSAGPDIVESVEYYRMIAEELGVDLQVEDLPVNQALAANPDWRFFLCHRVYDLSPLRLDGLKVPNTPLRDGLREHIRWLDSRASA